MAETKPWAIVLVIVCTVFTAFGLLCFKKGVDRFAFSVEGALAAYPVLIGFFFYFLGFLLLTFSFRHGELSVLYPFISLSFIWVALFSYLFLSELISTVEIAGVTAIVCGVVLIGISSKNKRRIKFGA